MQVRWCIFSTAGYESTHSLPFPSIFDQMASGYVDMPFYVLLCLINLPYRYFPPEKCQVIIMQYISPEAAGNGSHKATEYEEAKSCLGNLAMVRLKT